MRAILFILAVVAFVAGVGTTVEAQSAVHEIEGLILFLMGAILLSGAATVEAVHLLRIELKRYKELIEPR